MKTFPKLVLLTLGLALASLPLTAASDTAAPSDPAPVARFPRLRAMMIRRMAVARQVARRLGLTGDQMARLKSLRQETASRIKGIRTDSALTKEQKLAKAREILRGARSEMRGVLTAEQQARLARIRRQLQAFRGGGI
jgi:hypothetical protein